MLVAGICNPRGERSGYNGLYLTEDEITRVVSNIKGVPVKAEHTGEALGRVVSGFVDESGALNCVVYLDDTLEGSIAKGLVRDGIAADFSLGYSVDVSHSQATNGLKAGQKTLLEISLVRRGAREGCHVLAYADEGDPAVSFVSDPWSVFDLTNSVDAHSGPT